MTLLNTLSNLGGNWISTTVLFVADYLTWKKCPSDNSRCETKLEEQKCNTLGGVCQSYIDAYYIEVMICSIVGILWLLWKYRTIIRLQSLPMSAWQVRSRQKSQLYEEDDDVSSLIMTA